MPYSPPSTEQELNEFDVNTMPPITAADPDEDDLNNNDDVDDDDIDDDDGDDDIDDDDQ